MPDLLCMGEPMLELNQRRPAAASGGGEELFLQGHGGDTSNAAVAAARDPSLDITHGLEALS